MARQIQNTVHLPRNRLALYSLGPSPGRYSLSLPIGITCPFAGACRTFVDSSTLQPVNTGGKSFLCFYVSQQAHPRVNTVVHHNFRMLVSAVEDGQKGFDCLIGRTLDSAGPSSLLLHEAGDFFSRSYLDMWLSWSSRHPDLPIEIFSKNTAWLLDSKIPDHVKVVVSSGGTQDNLLEKAFEAGFGVDFVDSGKVAEVQGRETMYPKDRQTQVSSLPLAGVQFSGSEAGDYVESKGTGISIPRNGTTRLYQAMKVLQTKQSDPH
jgi:hypothetical protein